MSIFIYFSKDLNQTAKKKMMLPLSLTREFPKILPYLDSSITNKYAIPKFQKPIGDTKYENYRTH